MNDKSIAAVDSARFSKYFVKPLYDTYSFARIPETVIRLLTGKSTHSLPEDAIGGVWDKYDCVLLFLVDGFGFRFFDQYASEYPFLRRFASDGIVTKISAQFPSTTAAHITTLSTGMEVGQSGIYEWFYYEPLVDRMIAPLPFCYAGDRSVNTLCDAKIPPEQFFPKHTIYEELNKHGVDSHVLQHESIAHSFYSSAMCKGANVHPFTSLTEGLEKSVNLLVESSTNPVYIHLYFGDIDTVGHRSGIQSSEFAHAVDSCWKVMEEHFWKKVDSLGKRVACIVTADHGMISLDPKTTIQLNEMFPGIVDEFICNAKGEPLVPAGSSRDFFLHIKPKRLKPVLDMLRNALKGIAEVYLTSDLIENGFFGLKRPSQEFLKRVGNLVILPYANESIWWHQKGRFEQNFYASHGGLTPEEMHSLFLFTKL
ncbi:MAG: alkaline phosphatase family protein [Chlamydiales bacterium]|nr:alkaline phosphatase family protein [Chlamydiales bacterium]